MNGMQKKLVKRQEKSVIVLEISKIICYNDITPKIGAFYEVGLQPKNYHHERGKAYA